MYVHVHVTLNRDHTCEAALLMYQYIINTIMQVLLRIPAQFNSHLLLDDVQAQPACRAAKTFVKYGRSTDMYPNSVICLSICMYNF